MKRAWLTRLGTAPCALPACARPAGLADQQFAPGKLRPHDRHGCRGYGRIAAPTDRIVLPVRQDVDGDEIDVGLEGGAIPSPELPDVGVGDRQAGSLACTRSRYLASAAGGCSPRSSTSLPTTTPRMTSRSRSAMRVADCDLALVEPLVAADPHAHQHLEAELPRDPPAPRQGRCSANRCARNRSAPRAAAGLLRCGQVRRRHADVDEGFVPPARGAYDTHCTRPPGAATSSTGRPCPPTSRSPAPAATASRTRAIHACADAGAPGSSAAAGTAKLQFGRIAHTSDRARSSSVCVPMFTMRPWSMTTMRSALRTVASRCAMIKVVRCCIRCSRASCTRRSLSASSELVASSSSRIGRILEDRPGNGESLPLSARRGACPSRRGTNRTPVAAGG